MAAILLAAVGCAELSAAYETVRTHGLAVFGTMDGATLRKLQAEVTADEPVPVYLYAPT